MAALSLAYDGHRATITLTQPEVRNAFSDEVIADITAAFLEVGARPDVRVVVLAAEGPAFCAGANLNWMRRMADYTRDENLADAGKLAEMLRVIFECPKPTIARVQGDVYAGGMGLVAACDMAVSVDTAGFCLSEVKLGLIPATISPYVIRAMGARADVRCVVLAAEGPAFCAGANLHWMRRMADYTREENIADAGKLAEMLRVIYECPKPTIARVQGDVYAGGMGLVAACDMAVAVDTAGFCLSEVKLGLIPATISPYVIRAMGARAAHRYFLTAERFDAAEALRIGFVHAVVVAEQLDAQVDALAQALSVASPQAVRACKKLVIDVAEREIDASLIAATVEGIADIRASEHGREGVQSFLQKRKPGWLNA